jgi:hypothetical protein
MIHFWENYSKNNSSSDTPPKTMKLVFKFILNLWIPVVDTWSGSDRSPKFFFCNKNE